MGRILIADDSILQRRSLTAIVSRGGHVADTAKNGREALEAITHTPPDCLLLDMLMPEVDGMQVLETLQAQGVNIPVIVLTADIQDWLKTRCLEMGAKHFLNKPVKPDALLSAIADVVGAPVTQEASCG